MTVLMESQNHRFTYDQKMQACDCDVDSVHVAMLLAV